MEKGEKSIQSLNGDNRVYDSTYVLQSERTTRILIELKLNRNSVILSPFPQYMKFNNNFGYGAMNDIRVFIKICLTLKSVRIESFLGRLNFPLMGHRIKSIRTLNVDNRVYLSTYVP